MLKSTHDFLKNFSQINQSILIREGNYLRTVNAEKTSFAVAKLEESFPQEFAIFDLTEFLSCYSLLDNPSIEFSDTYMTLSSHGAEIQYHFSPPKFIKSAPQNDLKLPPVELSFTLEKTTLEQMQKASSVMKLDDLYVTPKKVIARRSDGTGNVYTCPIVDFKVGEVDDVDGLEYSISIDNLRLIPDTYDVTLTSKTIRLDSRNMDLYYIVILNEI